LTNRISTGGASLGDLDGDGDLELVVPMSGQVAAYHHDGRFVSGWPVPTRADAAYPAAVGNIDASAGAEVVIHGTGPFLGSLQAWSANGRVLSGFGMPVEAGAKAPLLLTEVDGRVAVVATSDSDHVRDRRGQRVSKERLSLHLWQLPQAYDPATMPWPTYQHDVSRRGSAD
ncbi:MAG TPA: hypothetical protein VG602_10215, partial [Actinomycetota bacterium]|nr:hypothetical protein [Actinomycetota bacterium]